MRRGIYCSHLEYDGYDGPGLGDELLVLDHQHAAGPLPGEVLSVPQVPLVVITQHLVLFRAVNGTSRNDPVGVLSDHTDLCGVTSSKVAP